jgi:hypothetical protein
MRELSSVAENLRLVQNAKRKFLELWSVESKYINPMLDRMADDLQDVLPGVMDDPQFDPPGGAGETL